METKINVAELLKDCPQGMELDCTMYEDCTLNKVYSNEVNTSFPIRIETKNGYELALTKYGQYHANEYAKCVIFPKGKTTWEGFQRPFKDGDIVYNINKNGCSHISIYKSDRGDDSFWYHVSIEEGVGNCKIWCYNDKRYVRLATETEKQKLFDAIKGYGYQWNSKTKTLENIVVPKFKDGDIVVDIHGNSPFIYSGEDDYYWHSYCGKYIVSNELGLRDCRWLSKLRKIRLATDEEKEKLLQLIKANGYKWNAETKMLERLFEPKFKVGDKITEIGGNRKGEIFYIDVDKYHVAVSNIIGIDVFFEDQDNWELIPNKFDINDLKPFESRVLVRDENTDEWRGHFFSYYVNDRYRPYVCIGGDGINDFKQCIPYEGNEHLLGKTDDCDDFYKTWEE